MEGFRMSFDRIGGAPEHLLKENHYPIVSIPIPTEWKVLDLFSYLFNLAENKKITQMRDLMQSVTQGIGTLEALTEKRNDFRNVIINNK